MLNTFGFFFLGFSGFSFPGGRDPGFSFLGGKDGDPFPGEKDGGLTAHQLGIKKGGARTGGPPAHEAQLRKGGGNNKAPRKLGNNKGGREDACYSSGTTPSPIQMPSNNKKGERSSSSLMTLLEYDSPAEAGLSSGF